MRRFFAVLFLGGAFASLGAVASARPVVALQLSAAIVRHAADGSIKLVPANGAVLKADDIVRYDIVAINTGDRPAEGIRPVDAVPAGTTFVAGSASGGRTIEFSLDHGKTWSVAPMVVVHEKDGDKRVKADPSTYTAIRWTALSPLKPGASATLLALLTVSFAGVLVPPSFAEPLPTANPHTPTTIQGSVSVTGNVK